MKIDLTIKRGETRTDVNLAFDILSSTTPSNLWIISDKGIETKGVMQHHAFCFKKVVVLMEVKTIYEDVEYHGKVVSIANGEYGLMNLVVDLCEGEEPIEWEQTDNDFLENTYFVDLDELRQSRGYENLSVDDCFTKLLTDSDMEYNLRGDRYVELSSGKIKYAPDVSE